MLTTELAYALSKLISAIPLPKRNMETFVKIWFAQISLAAPKIRGGAGGGAVAAPQPQRHVRLWVLSPVFSIK